MPSVNAAQLAIPMDYLPLFIRLKDMPCLVVGGGIVATRKTRQLLRANAAVTVVASEPCEELRRLAKSGAIELAVKDFSEDCVGAAQFVIAATSRDQVNKRVAAAAAKKHRLSNVVDDSQLSTAIMPAIIDRSPLLIAISTGGRSPVLATQLRQRIEAMLPANYGQLADWAGRWRTAVQHRFEHSQQRLRFWQATLAGKLAAQVLKGETRLADQGMRDSLSEKLDMTGIAWLVGAGPGDPELLTLKALRCIQKADVVLHDRLIAPQILDHARKDADIIPVGKQAGEQGITQAEINALLVSMVHAGKQVCRLKGGDPFIFGRGGEELAALNSAGLPCEVIPGITAAAGCAAAASIPLTHRNVARSVTFMTGHTAAGLEPDWQQLAHADQTIVLYMALSRLEKSCTQLIAAGRDSTCPAVLIENGTTSRQRNFRGTLADLPGLIENQSVQSPALLIVGDVGAWATSTATDNSGGETEADVADETMQDSGSTWSPPASRDSNLLM